MKIGIPVIKGKLKVSLKEVDKLNILTKILLHSIEQKLNVKEIGRIINFSQKLIQDNIEELEKSGVIMEDINGNYQLTEVGKANLKLLNDIEDLNRQGIEVLVDSYTKHIFEKSEIEDRYFEKNLEGKNIIELPRDKNTRYYLSNLNPSNSKKIALKMLKKLEEEDRENLNVEVEIINENAGYIIGKIKDNIVRSGESSKYGKNITVRREIYKNKYTPVFNSLKKIKKESMEALVILGKNNRDLLSHEGVELLEKSRISKNSIIYYYDSQKNKLSLERFNSEKTREKVVINFESFGKNIDKNEIQDLKKLREIYGNDIDFELKEEKDWIDESFAIEDVIDIYEESKKCQD